MFTMRNFVQPRLVTALVLPIMLASAAVGEVLPDTPGTEIRGHVSKETALGEAYLTGKGVPQDIKQAAYWYEKAAGLGDPVAQNQIGYLYQVGLGVPADPIRAVHWYQLAAANGLADAKVNLAVAYIWGTGAQRNTATGEQLLLEAAGKGNPIAATYLGDMHYLGIGVPKDEAAGEKWYEKAVKEHSYLAEYRMGMILSESTGHSRNVKLAVSLFRQSAAAGFVPAMHSLGRLLVNHPELCDSHDEALRLLNDAASAGTWQSSMVLGALARDGKWVPRDERQAYLHFRAGAIQGGEPAKALAANDLQRLSTTISAEDRAKLDDQAQAWAHEHGKLISMMYRGQKSGSSAVALVAPSGGAHAGTLLPLTAF
jgi:TPR repeat protein